MASFVTFVKTDNTNKETSSSSQKVSLAIQSPSNITGETESQYVQKEIKKQVAKPAKHYDNIPSKIKQEIGSYALIHGTKAAIDRFPKVDTKYSLKRTTVGKKGKKGRPNLVDDETLKEIKYVIIGSRLAGTVIYRKMIVAIGTGVVKTNEPKILRGFGGSLELTEGWARNVLKGIDWVKRKGTTGKVEPCLKFLQEEKFTFQRAISKFVSDHDTPLELVLNLDQTPISYVSPGKYKFDLKGSKTVPMKGVDDKRQITATFAITASDSFLSIRPGIWKGFKDLFIVVKLSVVYPSMISLFDLMLPSLQIIGPIMKNVSDCSRKSSFLTLKPRKKSLITQRSSSN